MNSIVKCFPPAGNVLIAVFSQVIAVYSYLSKMSGPNDVDAIANGIVTDPGGIAIYIKQGSAPSVKIPSLSWISRL